MNGFEILETLGVDINSEDIGQSIAMGIMRAANQYTEYLDELLHFFHLPGWSVEPLGMFFLLTSTGEDGEELDSLLELSLELDRDPNATQEEKDALAEKGLALTDTAIRFAFLVPGKLGDDFANPAITGITRALRQIGGIDFEQETAHEFAYELSPSGAVGVISIDGVVETGVRREKDMRAKAKQKDQGDSE